MDLDGLEHNDDHDAYYFDDGADDDHDGTNDHHDYVKHTLLHVV